MYKLKKKKEKKGKKRYSFTPNARPKDSKKKGEIEKNEKRQKTRVFRKHGHTTPLKRKVGKRKKEKDGGEEKGCDRPRKAKGKGGE